MKPRPWVMGHRGWRDRVPENTLPSFEAALALGCDALELDVHLSRDGEVVVIHDETVDRTTDGEGCVHDFSVADLQRLDAGSWFGEEFAGLRIPTLRQVVERVPPDLPLFVEVKDGRPAIIEPLLALVELRADSTIVHSFDREFLEVFRRAAPAMATGVLGNVTKQDMRAEAERLGCRWIHPCMEGLTPETVAAWRAEGFGVMTWTVRDSADARRAVELGVDVIGADCPDVLLRLLGRLD
ncbi:glycerophosphodiester phosphodiesterase [bacterium]|nr:glycerophosphodiester phosphodiesterase [bacterium]